MSKAKRAWKFFAHFNRVNMQRKSPNVWTVHFRGTCYQGTNIIFAGPVVTTYDPDGPQPRAKLVGNASLVTSLTDGTLWVR